MASSSRRPAKSRKRRASVAFQPTARRRRSRSRVAVANHEKRQMPRRRQKTRSIVKKNASRKLNAYFTFHFMLLLLAAARRRSPPLASDKKLRAFLLSDRLLQRAVFERRLRALAISPLAPFLKTAAATSGDQRRLCTSPPPPPSLPPPPVALLPARCLAAVCSRADTFYRERHARVVRPRRISVCSSPPLFVL